MPQRKAKPKSKSKHTATVTIQQSKPAASCSTLEEDEMTRCTRPPTHGNPTERCETHDRQYRKMTQRYKDASKKVDQIRNDGHAIPTKQLIQGYRDFHEVMGKARRMRAYLEAIRVEKTGREIHHKRFFMKVDDGHKIRIKVLAKEMVTAVEALDCLQARAVDIYITEHPEYGWMREFQNTSGLPGFDKPEVQSPAEVGADIDNMKSDPSNVSAQPIFKSSEGCDEDDLIDLEIQAEKECLRHAFEFFFDRDSMFKTTATSWDAIRATADPDMLRQADVFYHTWLQYARRILFYDEGLFLKALDKVSFKDLILDPNFSFEDVQRFGTLWSKRMELGLLWWKDATIEAIALCPSSGSSKSASTANVGDPKDRVHLVGGWIFNRPHTRTITNEVWWHVLKFLKPPAGIENRFVRLCNNFDDMHAFLSFGALGMIPPPPFCANDPSSHTSRNHLSLCGVIVTDMISTSLTGLRGPLPSPRIRAKTPGCITWAEMEFRAYMFGAVRNEPDAFTEAFLTELRARDDIYLITRSETDPGRKVEISGGLPGEELAQVRSRTFEAPFANPANRPQGCGNWTIERSAVDVLYGNAGGPTGVEGYLTTLARPKSSGWFFHFKKFPVKFFVILDAIPGRHHRELARQVSWAALRAHGLAHGDYTLQKYAKASDALFEKHASERLGWMPEGYGGWSMTRMSDETAD